MSIFVLKIIAVITMLIDHLSFVIYGSTFSWMRYIGRISFPIYAFLIAEGYNHTKNVKQYLIRLLIFALISQYPFDLFNSPRIDYIYLNIGFTLLLGLLSIIIYEKINAFINKLCIDKIDKYILKIIPISIVIIISIISYLINSDYSFFGVILIFIFHLFKNNKLLLNIFVVIWIITSYCPIYFNSKLLIKFIFYLIPFILINFYNGEKGKSFKTLFYLIYPVHLLILGILEIILNI